MHISLNGNLETRVSRKEEWPLVRNGQKKSYTWWFDSTPYLIQNHEKIENKSWNGLSTGQIANKVERQGN